MSTVGSDLERLLRSAGPLLLDFDGPVCGVFSTYQPSAVVTDLRSRLADRNILVPSNVAQDDPLQIIQWAGAHATQEVVNAVEDLLSELEELAVAKARPTDFARETIETAHRMGRPVAIVSNNSAPAITAHLTARGLVHLVHTITGRPYGQPHLMKPDPYPVVRTAHALGVDPRECVLVGDSTSDIEGAHAAETPCIAFANKPRKTAAFIRSSADVVITSMQELTRALERVGHPPEHGR